ncbi:uncharacterized protein LOC135943872 [Cloeon dipterum]|uniref:uncharacterized protein LOC135943872 n=1 Tax=Cloeon dipterum TaxID=197152 RepID=UPI0032209F73
MPRVLRKPRITLKVHPTFEEEPESVKVSGREKAPCIVDCEQRSATSEDLSEGYCPEELTLIYRQGSYVRAPPQVPIHQDIGKNNSGFTEIPPELATEADPAVAIEKIITWLMTSALVSITLFALCICFRCKGKLHAVPKLKRNQLCCGSNCSRKKNRKRGTDINSPETGPLYNTEKNKRSTDIGNTDQTVSTELMLEPDVGYMKNLLSLADPNDKKLIGKPKIQTFADVEAPQTDSILVDLKDLQVSATNHIGWLTLILKYEDALEKLIELFGKIDEKILKEHLKPLLTRESKREDAVLLNSTLQYLVNFSHWPRAFVKPKLLVKWAPRDQMDSTKSLTGEKIDFDTLLVMANKLFEENKNSIENQKLNPVGDLEANYVARDSTDASIVWLFNSVAGAGKSTVLKELAHQLTNHDGGFKILLIPLKKHYRYLFDMPALNVNEIKFLAKTTCNSHEDITNWIKKRELIVFLDGFDKVCPDLREKIIKILIALNNARVPLFIGTRPHEVHHIQERIKNTTVVEIEPLDEAKQIDFLRIVARKNPKEIEQFRKIFKDQDILGNPLYLSMLAEHSGDGNLYET